MWSTAELGSSVHERHELSGANLEHCHKGELGTQRSITVCISGDTQNPFGYSLNHPAAADFHLG